MTPEEADKAQNWAGMDGTIAWHLIDRHARDWGEAGDLMNAWLRANVLAEREACAKLLEANAGTCRDESMTRLILETNAAAIRARSNAISTTP